MIDAWHSRYLWWLRLVAWVVVGTFAPSSVSFASEDTARLWMRDGIQIPAELGYVLERWTPHGTEPNPGQPLVIQIQDLHTHYPAQQTIAKILKHLSTRYGIRQVAVEGAAGELETKLFAGFPEPDITRKVADVFMKHGLFTGAEFQAITDPSSVQLWGVEDELLYLEHVQLFQQNHAGYQQARAALAEETPALEARQAQTYPTKLKSFELL